ncbi:MAG: sulfide/dihydroorotate dehydrogenase-like FAD/NAD-binding protein [Candidatus Omnitrophota bacterium]|nr:sulfide/dihydroorotate dehydrogenase-like FAD/NAD-binding protein [Candidatus Omnitrophota bacterium]
MQIIKKEILVQAPDVIIKRIEVLSPLIAKAAQPGQFVVVMVSELGERIPLTIVDRDIKNGAITLIFQEVGLTTKLLGKMNAGNSLYALAGPLGHATEIKNYGKLILVGGGVGIAEIYPAAKAFKEAGNHITAILGARNKDLLILEQELKASSNELHITTDDGSYGRKGFVTDILENLLTYSSQLTAYSLIYAVGPIPMMKEVSRVANNFKIKTIVSLNPLMVDGTGMCGCCRVTVSNKTKFSCVDGPEFDGAQVDWDELTQRNMAYLDKERHICSIINLVPCHPERAHSLRHPE